MVYPATLRCLARQFTSAVARNPPNPPPLRPPPQRKLLRHREARRRVTHGRRRGAGPDPLPVPQINSPSPRYLLGALEDSRSSSGEIVARSPRYIERRGTATRQTRADDRYARASKGSVVSLCPPALFFLSLVIFGHV